MSRPDRVAGQRAEARVASISPLRRWLNRTLLGLGLAMVGAGLYQGGAELECAAGGAAHGIGRCSPY